MSAALPLSSSPLLSSSSSSSTTSVGWQCSPRDLNCQLRMAVFPALAHRAIRWFSPWALGSRTSTASSGRQCSPPDLNRKLRTAVFPPDLNRQLRMAVFPQPPAPDGSVPCRTEDMPDKAPERMSERVSEDMEEIMPKNSFNTCQQICQIEVSWWFFLVRDPSKTSPGWFT